MFAISPLSLQYEKKGYDFMPDSPLPLGTGKDTLM
jgi:hypothetical protein